MRKYKFASINDILPEVVQGLGLDRRLNEQALFSLWPSLIDEIYAKRSIPLYIDRQNILIIAVQDSSTAQEMSFLKAKLMKELRQAAADLGLSIAGMRFDLKKFHIAKEEETTEPFANLSNKSIDTFSPGDDELKAVVLTETQLSEINCLKEKIINITVNLKGTESDVGEKLAERIVRLVRKQLCLRNWHKSQNLPFCKECQEPLFQSDTTICRYCLQLKQMGSSAEK